MIAPKITHFLYSSCLKHVLFLFKPETMHELFGRVGHWIGKCSLTRKATETLFAYKHSALEQTVRWIDFANPVGLSAGFDKDVLLCHTMSDVGFGFMEVGSITRKPYDGNPKPWLYRLKKSEWLIVYYGLKNKGVDYAIQKLQSYNAIRLPIVVSVAKTNCAANADMEVGCDDYLNSLEALKKAGAGDLIEINISCPNAFGGEDFANDKRLKKLLERIRLLDLPQPLLVKLPVDKTRQELKPLVDLCITYGVAWVVVSNLSKKRESIAEVEQVADIPWGISGKPLQQISNQLIGKVYRYCGDKITIIGVWWIFSAEDAYEKIKQGASLVELITGMIFEWPQLIGSINKWLVELLKKDGYSSITEAIGTYHHVQ